MNKFKGMFTQSGIISKLLILIGFSCFFAVLGSMIWILITHGNLVDIGSLKLMQLIQSIGIFVLPPFVLAYLCSNNTTEFLHFDRQINLLVILFVVLFMILIVPFINLSGDLNQRLVLPKALAGLESMMKAYESQATQLTEKLLNVHNLPALFFNIFLIAIIPALGEELFFRGAIQGVLQQKINAKAAIWITAIVFSAIHFQFYGFVPRMLLGAFLGYLLVWSGNLWLSIAAHFTNNVLAIIFYYMKTNGYKIFDIDTIGTGDTLWIGCFSGLFAVFGFYFFMRYFQKVDAEKTAAKHA